MAKFILDTDICIYWLKGNENIERNIIIKGIENVFISVITECELFYGAIKSTKKENNLSVIEKMKKKILTLHTTDRVSYIYATAKSELEVIGQPLDDADLLIASIAIANDAILVTNNTEHFKRIQGLTIENWSKSD